MSKPLLLETTNGNAIDPHTGAESHLRVMARDPANGEESWIKDGVLGISMRVYGTPTPSFKGVYANVGGSHFRQMMDCPNGTIIKLVASRQARSSSVTLKEQMYIRLRSGAALRKIVCDNVGDQFSEGNVMGEFDVVPMAQYERHGITVKPAFQRFFVDMSTAFLFKETVLRQEIAPDTGSAEVSLDRKGKKTVKLKRSRRRFGK